MVLSTRAVSARSPPSPRLSARMITITYLIVTMRNRDQAISETVPRIDRSFTWPNWMRDWRSA